jgi:hypothetical protein
MLKDKTSTLKTSQIWASLDGNSLRCITSQDEVEAILSPIFNIPKSILMNKKVLNILKHDNFDHIIYETINIIHFVSM